MQGVRPAEQAGAPGSDGAQLRPAQPAEVHVAVQGPCAASGALPSAAQQGNARAAGDDEIDVVSVEPPSRQQECQDGQPQSEETQPDAPGLRRSDGDSGRTVTATGIAAVLPINQEHDLQQMQSSPPARDTSLPGEGPLKAAASVLEGAGAATGPLLGADEEAATSMANHRRGNGISSASLQQQSSEALHEAPWPDNTAPGKGECTLMFPAGQCSQAGSLADGGHAAAASHQSAEGNASAALQAGSQSAGDCTASPSKSGLNTQQPHTGPSLGRNSSDGLAADETRGIPTPIDEPAIKQARDVSKRALGHSDDARCARRGLPVWLCILPYPRVAVWQGLTRLLLLCRKHKGRKRAGSSRGTATVGIKAEPAEAQQQVAVPVKMPLLDICRPSA